MDRVLKKLLSIYSIWPMILTVGIGIYTLFVDCKTLKYQKNLKEARWAKWIGLIYMIGGVAFFLFIKLLT
ncbi:CLC_0170 family protein [Defluviitalea raffinosedens]|uniref:CLC_0170 family protein n=1 Tax=Defluviitalea raffinosedens TaxID=1450156 RepID=UPI001957C0AE|nr:CLC_0170 family protein [Defluviitalea raffinosedens]MBM7685076.1 hypothetical protein [Defluviitalea raffinosedens]